MRDPALLPVTVSSLNEPTIELQSNQHIRRRRVQARSISNSRRAVISIESGVGLRLDRNGIGRGVKNTDARPSQVWFCKMADRLENGNLA